MTGIDSALLVTISAIATPPMASGSENRMVNGWITSLKSRISTASTSIRPSSMALTKPWMHLRPGSWCRRFRLAAPSAAIWLLDDLVEGGRGRVERDALRQVGADRDDAVAVVTLDRAWAFRIVDIGDDRERHGGAGVGLDLQRLDGGEVAADVERSSWTRIGICRSSSEILDKGCIDIADRGDADEFGDLLPCVMPRRAMRIRVADGSAVPDGASAPSALTLSKSAAPGAAWLPAVPTASFRSSAFEEEVIGRCRVRRGR